MDAYRRVFKVIEVFWWSEYFFEKLFSKKIFWKFFWKKFFKKIFFFFKKKSETKHFFCRNRNAISSTIL